MATVTSLTEAKISELMVDWEGVALDQDTINAIVTQLWTDVEGQGASLQDFLDNTLADLLAAQDANDVAVQDLVTNVIPNLNTALDNNELAITNLNTVTLPLLDARVHTNELWIIDLNDVILPDLYSDLAANQAALDTFNTVTLPGLLTDLGTLEGKFPVGTVDIQNGAITADLIATDAVTANKIAAGVITAVKIAANTITANEIASNAITVNELAAGAVTAAKIAADTITANEIATDTITANEIAADTITASEIAADTITANEIAADTITANEIAADSITANELAVGTITAVEIAAGTIVATNIMAGTITAVELDVESITAAVINTGAIQSQLSITGVLEISGANMGWSAAEGLYLGDNVRFYGDDRINQLEGDLTTERISVKTGLSIGGDADLHGDMIITNGVVTPTGKMALGQTWPKGEMFGGPDHETDNSAIFQGLLDWSSSQWLVAFNFFGAGLRLFNKSDLSWGGDLTLGTWKNQFYPNGGIAKVGSSLYVLGSDGDRNGDHYIYKLSSSGTIDKEAERFINGITGFDGKRPRLVSDGTNIGMIWAQKSSGDLKLRWYNPGLTAQVGTDEVLLSDVGVVNTGDAYWGPAQAGGTTRLWVSLYTGDSNMVRCWNTSLARVSSEDFPRASGATILGLSYDSTSTNLRMVSYDKLGWFYTYSKYVSGGDLNGQYTQYDGDNSNYPSGTIINDVDVSGTASGYHETPPSPVTTFALSKRAWPTITAPPAQDELVTDANQVDKANRLGIYASVGSTPRLQSYLAVGVRTLPLTDELSVAGAVAGSSGVPDFSDASVPDPGRLRSAGLDANSSPLIDILGVGSGRMGHSRWDEKGLPLNFGSYKSTTAQACAASTFVTRTGWTQINSTDAPAHGITYSSGSFTISQSGLWLLSAAVTTTGGNTTNGRKVTLIYVDGVSKLRGEGSYVDASQDPTPCASGVIYLPAGAVVTIRHWHNHTASRDFTANEEQNYFTAYCLAAF